MKKTAAEHALAIFKAGVSAVPGVGGPIASLIADYIPSATQKSTKVAIELLKERLRNLEDRIDPQAVNKDEFAELFKSCYLIIVRTHQEDKLRGAANLIANILLKDADPDKLSYTELDHFVKCLDSLSIGAIEALGHVFDVVKPKRSATVGSSSLRLQFDRLNREMEQTEPSLLMGLVGELNSMNLVHVLRTPTVRTPDYGNYPLELTRLGIRFIQHVLEAGGAHDATAD